ncbi:hypothetical protein D7V93_32165 [Corallococcus llansteffanensis]|uniref:Lipoprotein n=2 Tax=Corallococcus llansteffanensis TaxID=2316731 RepID=A0A3A8P739_9BACT|nr:hypothetical protein D7V93_32165 [Corallococcus llansteffanensis]
MFMGRLLTATMLGAFAGCQAEPSQESGPKATSQEMTAATDGCVNRFEGITHCTTGNAALDATDEGLVVTGLGNGDEDGVVGAVGRAESWRQHSIVDFGEGDKAVTYYGRSEDQVISTLRMAPDPDHPGVLRLRPTFTGSPGGSDYTIIVRDHGEQVAYYKLPGDRLKSVIVEMQEALHRWLRLVETFSRSDGGSALSGDTQGACIWTVHFQENSFRVTLDDGTQVTGDEIEFVEQLEDGAYPYSSFTHIGMTGAVNKVTVLDESVTLNSK